MKALLSMAFLLFAVAAPAVAEPGAGEVLWKVSTGG